MKNKKKLTSNDAIKNLSDFLYSSYKGRVFNKNYVDIKLKELKKIVRQETIKDILKKQGLLS